MQALATKMPRFAMPRMFRGRDNRNPGDSMERLQKEMDRLQSRMNQLKEDLERLKD